MTSRLPHFPQAMARAAKRQNEKARAASTGIQCPTKPATISAPSQTRISAPKLLGDLRLTEARSPQVLQMYAGIGYLILAFDLSECSWLIAWKFCSCLASHWA